MGNWVLDLQLDLRVRRLGWNDISAAAEIARRAFDSAATGERMRRTLMIHCATGSADLPLEKQSHTLVPTAYYLMTRGEQPHESALGISGLYTRMWDDESEGNYWLGWFAVDPTFQGQGFGERLLRATMAICAAKGGKRLSVETASGLQRALDLYRRLGFTGMPAIPNYWGPGSDLQVLHRNLDQSEFHDLVPPGALL